MNVMYATDKRTFSKEGFLLADATITKVGALPYKRSELGLQDRPDDLFYVNKTRKALEDAIPSFMGAPITMDHPDKMLSPGDAKYKVVGAVASKPVIDSNGNVKAKVRIFDQEAITSINNGIDQLSPGFDFTVKSNDGHRADVDAMFVNHVAIVPRGRAGPTVRVRDSLPSTIKVNNMSTEAAPVDTTKELTDSLKAAFDAVLADKKSTDSPVDEKKLDQFKAGVVDTVVAKMQPALDAMVAFQTAQEQAKAAAEAEKVEAERKTALDAAVKEATDKERQRFSLASEAKQANDSLDMNELIQMEPRDIMIKAIGDSFQVTDAMSDDMIYGVMSAMLKLKGIDGAMTPPNPSITPPPPPTPQPFPPGIMDGATHVPGVFNRTNVDQAKYDNRYHDSRKFGG